MYKILYFSLISIVFFFGCNIHRKINSVELNGKWKISECEIPWISSVSENDAEKNVGKHADIMNNVFTITLFENDFTCMIDYSSVKVVESEKISMFDPKDNGSLNLKVFKLSKKGFIFETERKNESEYYDLKEIFVNEDGNKIVINWGGAFFLLEKI